MSALLLNLHFVEKPHGVEDGPYGSFGGTTFINGTPSPCKITVSSESGNRLMSRFLSGADGSWEYFCSIGTLIQNRYLVSVTDPSEVETGRSLIVTPSNPKNSIDFDLSSSNVTSVPVYLGFS